MRKLVDRLKKLNGFFSKNVASHESKTISQALEFFVQMKFKRSLFLVLVGFVLTAAIPLEAEGYYAFDGFYLGAVVGPEIQRADAEMATSVNFFDSYIFLHLTANANHQTTDQIQVFGEIFGGWGKQWIEWFYLGGRLGVNFSSFHVTSSNTFTNHDPLDSFFISTHKNKTTTQLGSAEFTFDLKPGLVFYKRSMLFGMIGGACTNGKLKGESDFTFLDLSGFFPPGPYFNSVSLKQSKTLLGFRYGLGLETFLSKYFSLQVSYIYTHYRKLTASETTSVILPVPGPPNGYTAQFSTKPSKQLFSLGLTGYF